MNYPSCSRLWETLRPLAGQKQRQSGAEAVPSNPVVCPNLAQLYFTFSFLRSLVTEIGGSEKANLT